MLFFGSAAADSQQALVVEGGAMRGIFAAGVLDELIRAHHFPYAFCLGVSAGATALAAYLSGQVGRTHKVITDISCRKEFISLPRFLRGGHWLGPRHCVRCAWCERTVKPTTEIPDGFEPA